MILKLFLFWRLGLFSVTYIGSLVFEKVANGGLGAIGPNQEFDFWASWAQWDGGHYINISRYGYFAPNEYAFFPLFPILIRITGFVFLGHDILAGLVIANLAFLIFLYVFYKLAKIKFGEKVAKISTVFLITFPSSFFGGAVYSESIFLLLCASTFLFLEKKNFVLAIICAALASATRFIGVMLLIPIIAHYAKSIDYNFKNLNFKVLLIPFAASGILAYCLFLYFKFKDPFYFWTVQSVWHRYLTNPFVTIYSYFANNFLDRPINDYLDVFSTVGFILILISGVRKLPKAWIIYSFLAIIIPASTGTLTSMPRFVLAAFPVFMLGGYYLRDRKVMQIIVWIVFLLLQVTFAIKFVNGFWAA